MNYLIRNLQVTDYDKHYFELLKQLSLIEPQKITRVMFNKFVNNLNDNHIIYVIEDEINNIIIGTVTLLKEKKLIHNLGTVLHIEDLVIDINYRKKGLSIKLIDLCKTEANNCGAYKIILDCSVELESFYNKNGFEKKNIQMSLYNDMEYLLNLID
jgi:glucosamine-phosphate N-acetyltransferase